MKPDETVNRVSVGRKEKEVEGLSSRTLEYLNSER